MLTLELLTFRRNDKLKARKMIEVEKARTLAAFVGDRSELKERRTAPTVDNEKKLLNQSTSGVTGK